MPTYKPAEYSKLEYSEDPEAAEPVWVNVNFLDPSEVTITTSSVRQGINEGQQATAKKLVEGDFLLFDSDVKSSLETLEQSITPIAWRLTNIDGSTKETVKLATFSIDEEITTEEGLQGFQVLTSYHVGYSQAPLTSTEPS